MSTLRLLPLLLATALPLQAAESELDATLEGFDEPAAAPLDEALQGFDEAPAKSELEGVLEGFDEGNGTATPPVAATDKERPWQAGGALTLGSAWNYAHQAPAPGATDWRGLSRLRAKLNLEFDAKFGRDWSTHLAGYAFHDLAYWVNGRDDYRDELLDSNESELELGELWLRGRLNSATDLKLGRQIVVWGKSDNIRVTDLINPIDNREPGMVDIEDLRLPLAMARLDYYIGDWGITALAIPEIRFTKMPPYGSDFYPQPAPPPRDEIPEGVEFGLAANGIFSGWDLSLYAARLYDDNSYRVTTASGPELRHAPLTMGGGAINIAIDNWLLKGEYAHLRGLNYSALPGSDFNRSDSLLGVEYSGFSDTTLSLEIANRHLHDYVPTLQATGTLEDEWQTALRYQGDFMHARLHLLALLSAFGEQLDEGGFGRYSAAYDIADGLTLTAGVVTYFEGEKFPFSSYGDNDRLFLDLKYSF